MAERLRSLRDGFAGRLGWLTGTTSGRGRGFSLMSAGNLLAAVFMYLRQAEFARMFGTDWRTDAFAIALMVPTLLREIVANSFGSTFLPVYSDVVRNRGMKAARALTDRVITWIGLAGVLLTVVLAVIRAPLVRACGPGLAPQARDLAEAMVLVLLPTVLLSAVSGILQGLYNHQRRFGMTALIRLLEMGGSYATVLAASGRLGVMVMPASVLCGVLAAFLAAALGSPGPGYRWKPVLDTREPAFGTQISMAVPVIVGTLLGLLTPFINRVFASLLTESSVTALDYSDRMVKIALSVVFLPVMTLADTAFSDLTARRDMDGFRSELRSLLYWCSFGMVPASLVLAVLAGPVVSVLFQRGSFDAGSTRLVAWSLVFYAPWIAQYGFGTILQRGFYALKDTKTPVALGVWAMIVNALLCVLLVGPLGVGGLALAVTLASTAKTVLQAVVLDRKAGGIGAVGIMADHARIVFPALIAAGCVFALSRFAKFDLEAPFAERAVLLAIYIAVGAVAYLLASLAAGSPGALRLLSREGRS
ncbi:murein biosynthesis integral membrane protein MurJ [Candidatus Fermentibacteria bacterium]|nr:murein biosynthesis integral membrane protein MurJ [Candidatus Fermentibacteria bacterium]